MEQTFQRPCVGCVLAVVSQHIRGDKWLVDTVVDAGFSYVSSLLWGPETTVPALAHLALYLCRGHPNFGNCTVTAGMKICLRRIT